MSNHRRNAKWGFVIFAVIALLAYGLFQSKKLIEGPQITVFEPQDGATLTENLVTIKGVAKNIAYIKLDDSPIFVDNSGLFSEQLLVPVGYSTIKVSAQDKFGRVEERFIHVELPTSTLPAVLLPQQLTPTHATTSTTSKL
jgi:hypothetical protein